MVEQSAKVRTLAYGGTFDSGSAEKRETPLAGRLAGDAIPRGVYSNYRPNRQLVNKERIVSLESRCTSAIARDGGGVKSSMGEFQILW